MAMIAMTTNNSIKVKAPLRADVRSTRLSDGVI
jgi:hypothetical protein